jgi:hypothetical protein
VPHTCSEGRFVGPGQTGLLPRGSGWYTMTMHYYDKLDQGKPKLRVLELEASKEGWLRCVMCYTVSM